MALSSHIHQYLEQALVGKGYVTYYSPYNDTLKIHDKNTNHSLMLDMDSFYNRNLPEILYDIDQQFKQALMCKDDFVHQGPTTKQLRDPRIRHAYEEMQILINLIGI